LSARRGSHDVLLNSRASSWHGARTDLRRHVTLSSSGDYPDTPVDRNINTDAGAGFEVPPQEAGTDAADAGEDGDS
jgi:hypothetical protein